VKTFRLSMKENEKRSASEAEAPDWLALDRAHVWHPYTQMQTAEPPLPVVRAAGAWLELADGRRVLDGISSWWVTLHGHAHPRLVAAAAEQAARLEQVIFAGFAHEPAARLAAELVAIAPPGLTRVFYSDDGSTTVEVAMKMAVQLWRHRGEPGRTLFVALEGAYHGDTFGAMSVGDPDPFFSAFAPLLFSAQRVAPDAQALESALESLGERAAGVILEPLVQAAAGMRMHTEEFLRAVRRACDRAGVPLIADEVFTGFGRTGALFAAEHAGVSPDIMCVGKAITGGYITLAATLCSRDIANTISTHEPGALMHGPTFMANALACAVGVASVELLLEQDWRSRVRGIEAGLRDGLAPAASLPGVADVRVLGAIGVIEMDEPVDLRVATPAALQRAVWLRPFRNLIYVMPPYICTPDEIGQITSAMVGVASELGKR
jgi:adenosylmethionine-8-amino-7-oxononanoate aminotransferase